MKTGTRFKRGFYETLEEVSLGDDDPYTLYVNAKIDVYEGTFDHDLKYATSPTTLEDRIAIATLTVPTSITYKTSLSISGLPADCYFRINGALSTPVSGLIEIPSVTTKIVEIVFVGKYKHPTISIPVTNPIEDARDADTKWQALETATPAQIDTWITNNITDLASARNLLKTIVLALRYLNDRST